MKKILAAAFFVSAILLAGCNPGTPDFLDPPPPPPPPPNNPTGTMPYKIVEIDKSNDSTVILLTHTTTDEIKTFEAKNYVSGALYITMTGSFTYYPDGKLQHGIVRFIEPGPGGGTDRVDYYCPKNAAGQVIGFRTIDSMDAATGGQRPVYYYRHAYDNKGRLAKIYYDIDSANFFATAFPVNFRYVDSMIYDSQDRLTEWYYRIFDVTQNKYYVADKGTNSNFETTKSFIKPGQNAYIIFERESLLGGVPKTLGEQHYSPNGNLHTSFVSTVSITYDASNRVSVMNITSNPANNFSWNTGIFISDITQRKLYYK